jgi:hypothetical protein
MELKDRIDEIRENITSKPLMTVVLFLDFMEQIDRRLTDIEAMILEQVKEQGEDNEEIAKSFGAIKVRLDHAEKSFLPNSQNLKATNILENDGEAKP